MSSPPFTGARNEGSEGSELNALTFLIQQVLATVAGATPVKVVAVRGTGLAPVGFVDVLPMVNQVDGFGNAVPHAVVHNLPYFRLQGGANAVIVDPVAGDIGVAIFADRDVSSVKATRAQANPGSHRRNDWSDGFYVGGFMNAAPTQYVQFTASGIVIVSPTHITLQAPLITINGQITQTAPIGGGSGAVAMQGPVTVLQDVTAAGISLSTHHHTGVQPGSGTSGPPV